MKIKKHIKFVLSAVIIFAILFFVRDINIKIRKINKIKLNTELLRIINLDEASQRHSVKVFFNLAKIYSQEKDFDKAIILYERGLQFDYFKPEKLYELACVYEKKAKYAKAFEKLSEALSLKPGIFTRLAVRWEIVKLNHRKNENRAAHN